MKTGRCACGAVQYEVSLELTPVTFCHRSRCRREDGLLRRQEFVR